MEFDVAGAPSVALAHETGGGAGHEEYRTCAALRVERAPEERGGGCFVAGDAGTEHDARGMMARDEKAFEFSGGVFQHPRAPIADGVAEKEGVVGGTVEALPGELEGGETRGFGGIGYEPHARGAGRSRAGQTGGGHGEGEILVERVRDKPEARVERK